MNGPSDQLNRRAAGRMLRRAAPLATDLQHVPKWLKWTLGIFAGLIVLGALFGGDPESKDKQTATAASKPASAPARKTVTLNIASPGQDVTVHRAKVKVAGTVDPGSTVEVDGTEVPVDALGRWQRTMDFGLGDNDFVVTASKPGMDQDTESVSITRKRTAAQSRAFKRAQAIKRARRLAAQRRAA